MSKFNDSVSDNSISSYIQNLFKFSCSSLTDIFPIIFSYFVYNLNNNDVGISIAGMIFANFTLFFGFAFDFFEPVNTLCLPYLAKNNIKLYALKIWKVACFNVLFYLFGIICFSFVKVLIFKYETSLLENFLLSLRYGYLFALLPGLAFTINNFLRGNILNFRSHEQHQDGILLPLHLHLRHDHQRILYLLF